MSASTRGSAALPIVRVHLDSVDSTNSYARTHAKDFLPGALTVVTTDDQRAGRGRTTRVWKSTGDDLAATFAFQLPPHALATAYLLSPLLAVLATRALAKHGFKADIKWPNDLIVGQCRKVGGILCELEATGGSRPGYWAALGIGINVNSTPGDLGVARPIWPLTTLRAEAGGARQDVARLADDLAAEVAEALPVFLASGFAPFQREYEARSLLLHRRVRFRVDDSGTTTVTGRVASLGADGMMYIEEEGEGDGEGSGAATGAAVGTSSAAAAAAAGGAAGRLTTSTGGKLRGFLTGEVSGVELLDGIGTFVEGNDPAASGGDDHTASAAASGASGAGSGNA